MAKKGKKKESFEEAFARGRKIGAPLGGKAVAKKFAPPWPCPRCGKEYPFQTSWMAWIGHKGLHGLADKYFDGDIEAAQKRLRENGRAKGDPAPWNGAWPGYKPVTEE